MPEVRLQLVPYVGEDFARLKDDPKLKELVGMPICFNLEKLLEAVWPKPSADFELIIIARAKGTRDG